MSVQDRTRAAVLLLIAMASAGCHRSDNQLKFALEAEKLQDFDAAVTYYQQAQKIHPADAHIKIRLATVRAEACAAHLKNGREMRAQDNLDMAAGEFRRASLLDPGNEVARQELTTTLAAISSRNHSVDEPAHPATDSGALAYADAPPELKPLSRSPINLKMTNDSKIIFETIGKLAGLTVIFDPDFPARRISVELDNVTLSQALDIVALECKTFWKPVAENIILVVLDQQQKRRDYDDQVIQTFYLSNVVQPQDLTEVVNGLRQLIDLKKIQQLNSQNAIVIRDTPAKLAIAQKFIEDVDRAKPEVLLQVEVLQARTDLVKDLGINPGTSASLTFNPDCATTSSSSNCSSSSSSSSSSTALSLKQLGHLSSSDYSVTLPGASVKALLTDSSTKIIQNPEIRSTDGQPARLKIGDRVPVATGSFSSGATTTTSSTSALVQTQYQYIDVGVNVDVTPRIHQNREVSLKISVEVSSVTGYSTIGTLQEPIISQRKIEHDIRLKEGETSILGGLFEQTETKSLSGWPGLANLPLASYFFSEKDKETTANEVLIVLTPRIVRLPDYTAANLRPLYTGSENNVQLRPAAKLTDSVLPSSDQVPTNSSGNSANEVPPSAKPSKTTVQDTNSRAKPFLRFEPQELNVTGAEPVTIKLVADNVTDLFALPVLLEYDPKIINVEDLRQGNFFSDGGQVIAVVQQVDNEQGHAIVSVTRPPNVSGLSGSGAVLEIVVRGIAAGSSRLSIGAANAKNSKQAKIDFLSHAATITVSR